MALVKASIPVTAASVLDMLIVISGSTTAAFGNICGLARPICSFSSRSHSAAPIVTSLLLPDVVGTAMNGRPGFDITFSPVANSRALPSRPDMMATTLARSITLPPPMATTTPQPASRHSAAAASTRAGDGYGDTRSNKATLSSPSDSTTRPRMPLARRLDRPVTRNIRACSPANSSTRPRRSASLPTPNTTRVGLCQVKFGRNCSMCSL